MPQIEFKLHYLDNVSSDHINNCIDHLRMRYHEQVEDGSGDYETSVYKGNQVSESWLKDTYSPNIDNPDGYDLADDFDQYTADDYARSKWYTHGLVVDFWDMKEYDLSVGGLATPASANNSDGATFWASNARGTVHEAGHTIMDTEHWHHNMGREDDAGDTTCMGVEYDKGCSHIEYLDQGSIESGTSKMGIHTVDAVRGFRDNEIYYSGLDDCCYEDCTHP